MARIGMTGLQFETYISNLLAHALVAFGGYFLLGGVKLFTEHSTATVVAESTDPADGAFEPRHWFTMAVIAVLITSVIFFGVNVGMGAFLGATVLVLSGAGDDREAIKRMPWGVIVMVCGVTVLIALLERAQGIDLHRLAAGAALDARHSDRRRRVPDRRHLGLQQHFGRGAAGVSADGADDRAAAERRQRRRDRDVDERRRAPRRRVAALDDWRAVPRIGDAETRAGGSSTSCWPGGSR